MIRDDFWNNIPDDCQKAISKLKRLKVHELAAYDWEDTFADVWWRVLHEVDMWDEGEYRKEASATVSDPAALSRSQTNVARKWLVEYEPLFKKYSQPDKYSGKHEVNYQRIPN